MSRASRSSKLLVLADSDSDELSGLGAQIHKHRKSKTDDMAPTKKPRGRPPANKVTKPARKAARRPNDKLAAVLIASTNKTGSEDDVEESSKEDTKTAKRGRKADNKDEDESMVDSGEEDTMPLTTSTARPRGRPRAAAAVTTRESSNPTDKLTAQRTKRGRRPANKLGRNENSEILETQPSEATDIDTTDIGHSDDVPVLKEPVQRARARDNLDADLGDAHLRRRLGDAARKYENLELKYRDLREIGIKAAERNFDTLKKESDERANIASELINNLKEDLGTQRALAKEGQQSKLKLEEMEKKVAELSASLAEAKQEVKTLSNKLAASRSAEAAATAVTVKVPGSAIKGGNAAARAIATASSDAVQTAQLKEDLYGDLTGLIVRVVKRDSAGQVFDCIQTGRNGTLHFKLEVETENSEDSYEEAHFTYKPQLDSNRDRDLIDLLPDFLVEEIEFSRPHAAKFYSRVTKSLME
ncbi:chromosome segregation protein [Colletotrichum truncatum]|uniref:Chromosome segregation protein n=1 Tax=Colletotrichum truncatum TaxID=5467 RepID=A0ACC3ZJE0_COLTU|nr:chromosome segregation protein [Colletotrichum truncatum]KAF6782398.1 chromosome segregation protein [Colletotrichum truncatum]